MGKNYLVKKRKKSKIGVKTDYFFRSKIEYIDYKDTTTLQKFINSQGRIMKRKYTKLTAKSQRLVTQAIKRARQMALLPYLVNEPIELKEKK